VKRVLAGLVFGAAVSVGLLPVGAASASSGLCDAGSGVSVVVDAGSGAERYCAPDAGGEYADTIFDAVGVELTYASQAHGFVCRVNGNPSSDPCVRASPANAYWALFWSDGSGSWTYATSSVTGLKVPEGGLVGFVWQSSTKLRPPSVALDAAGSGPSSSASAPVTSSPSESDAADGDGVPVWVLILVLIAVAVSGAWIAWRRRAP